jgi:hypothetical protein
MIIPYNKKIISRLINQMAADGFIKGRQAKIHLYRGENIREATQHRYFNQIVI